MVPDCSHLTIRYHTLWLAEEQKAVLISEGYRDVVIEVVGPLCGFGDGDYDDWGGMRVE